MELHLSNYCNPFGSVSIYTFEKLRSLLKYYLGHQLWWPRYILTKDNNNIIINKFIIILLLCHISVIFRDHASYGMHFINNFLVYFNKPIVPKFEPELKYLGVKWKLHLTDLPISCLHSKSSLSKLISFRARSFHFPVLLDRMRWTHITFLRFNHRPKASHFHSPIFCATDHCTSFNFWCLLTPKKINNSFVYLICELFWNIQQWRCIQQLRDCQRLNNNYSPFDSQITLRQMFNTVLNFLNFSSRL